MQSVNTPCKLADNSAHIIMPMQLPFVLGMLHSRCVATGTAGRLPVLPLPLMPLTRAHTWQAGCVQPKQRNTSRGSSGAVRSTVLSSPGASTKSSGMHTAAALAPLPFARLGGAGAAAAMGLSPAIVRHTRLPVLLFAAALCRWPAARCRVLPAGRGGCGEQAGEQDELNEDSTRSMVCCCASSLVNGFALSLTRSCL